MTVAASRSRLLRWEALTVSLLLRIAAFSPIVLGSLYLLFFLPSAPAIAVIAATVESISFEVQVPAMAQLRLTGFALTYEDTATAGSLGFKDAPRGSAANRKPLCLSGLIVPEPGTRITYRRFGDGPVTVTFERTDGRPVATFQLSSGDLPSSLRQSSWIRLAAGASDDDKKACEGTSMNRLPLYGVAELGTELRPASAGDEQSSGALLEGTLDIFAQTLELPTLFQDREPRIYPASNDSITLPPGAQITEYVAKGQSRQPWAGFVLADADKALDVKLTLPAMRLAIRRPGIGTRPEVLSISLFTQLTSDPVLVSAQLIIAVAFASMQTISALIGVFGQSRSNKA